MNYDKLLFYLNKRYCCFSSLSGLHSTHPLQIGIGGRILNQDSLPSLAGAFKQNFPPALSQYEQRSLLYILHRFFPLCFGKGKGRRNRNSSHSNSQAGTRQVCRWGLCIRISMYCILFPYFSSINMVFPWARACNSLSCH